MLILTRRVGETLMVGDEVTVTVLGVKGNQVRCTAKRFTSAFRKRKTKNQATNFYQFLALQAGQR